MRARKSFLIVMILSIFLNGCVNIGRDFPGSEAVKGIQNGKTTKLEILEAFGTPRRTGIENGDEIWTYDYSKYLLGRTYTKDLIIRFNKEDVVESYSYSNNFPDAR